jgi:isoleucyl-tRNA synthetase
MALSFENKDKIDENKDFPADFIAEGVDQTWMVLYFTCDCDFGFDKVAYKK